ncbi:unnamed protein product [Orchesella dallaii]|uniref:Uncharacterized protein n=1 Tax=Orchesella dallaii TaxID=48710 RepID=A0ABP1PUP6_9HEXA
MVFQDGVELKSLEMLKKLTLDETVVKRINDGPVNEERLLLSSDDEDEDYLNLNSWELEKLLNESGDGSGSEEFYENTTTNKKAEVNTVAQEKETHLAGNSAPDEGFGSDETLNGLSSLLHEKEKQPWFICKNMDKAFANGGSNPNLCPTKFPCLTDQEKKRRREIRFGCSGNTSSIQSMESVDNLDQGFCTGKAMRVSRVELSDAEKKRKREARFGLNGKTDEVPAARGIRNMTGAEGVAVPMEVDDQEGLQEVKASKEKIGALVDSVLEDLESYYIKQRSQLLKSNGLVSTPLHALKEYAEFARETMHQEITCLPIAGRFKPLIRTEMIVGRFRGVGEAYDRRASGQMAALDVLTKMKLRGSCFGVVPFGLPPGWRISPRVSDDLNKFCSLNGLQNPRFSTKSNIDDKDKPVLRVECFVGPNLVARVDTDVLHYGRKKAASLALERLSGNKYPREYLTFGAACLSYKDLTEIGFKPVMSAQKRVWMLQQFKQYGDGVYQYGVDKDELHGLQAHLKNLEIQGEAYNGLKRRIQITIPNGDSDALPARKVIRIIK